MRNLLFVGISALLLHLLISAAVIQYQWFPGRKTISIGLFIAGALVAGEALALLVGMHLPVGIHHPWLSLKNYSFLILDIAIGSAILAAAFRKQDELLSGWLLLLAGAALLLHLYREWEHLSGLPNRFCANQPPFIVNTIKLLVLLFIVSLTAAYIGEKPYINHQDNNASSAASVQYSVTASDISYARLAEEDIVSLLAEYKIGIILAVREDQLGSELDSLLDMYEANHIQISLAPLLSEEQGLYLNKDTAGLYLKLVQSVLQWTDANHHPIAEIVADIEPSYLVGAEQYFDFGRFLGGMDQESYQNAMPVFQEIISEIKSHGCKAVSCATWFTIEDKNLGKTAWQDFFGGPSIDAQWDSTLIMMYTEWFLESGRIIHINRDAADALIYRYCSSIASLWGQKGGVILGSITGSTGSFYESGTDIAKTVAAAKAAGVKRLCLYDLKGILETDDMNAWFQSLTETKQEAPKTGFLQARMYMDVFRCFSRILNIKETLS